MAPEDLAFLLRNPEGEHEMIVPGKLGSMTNSFVDFRNS
jgi:hypothetical protein